MLNGLMHKIVQRFVFFRAIPHKDCAVLPYGNWCFLYFAIQQSISA